MTNKNNFQKMCYGMLLVSVMAGMTVKSQIRIGGSSAPNDAAILDLNPANDQAATKALALPRVALSGTTDNLGATNSLRGMIVYNTSTTGGLTEGVYFHDGTVWAKANGGGALKSFGVAIATAPYTVTPDDDLIITQAAGSVNIVMPPLGSDYKGKTVYILNDNSSGSSNTFSGSTVKGKGVTMTIGSGSLFIYGGGDTWYSISK